MKKLTIIMPCLNEGEEVRNTIESIYETFDSKQIQIIVIDDYSDNTVSLDGIKDFKDVIKIRNKQRQGVDKCRQMGGEMTQTPYLFIIDAHLRFVKDKWLEKIEECLEREPQTVFCTTCLGLGYGTMDLNKVKGKYYGANILFLDPNAPKSRESRECLECKWKKKEDQIEYIVPSILGASYFMRKDWFDYIGGFRGLEMWGSSEILISLKSWMAGGKCKIRTDLEIGHKFRSNSPFTTFISFLYYNKIYICDVLDFPKELKDKILNALPHNVNYKKAIELAEKNKEEIEKEKEYYRSIFKKDIYQVCEELNIKIPD